jgi:predicted TIM-barrel fold metal-dependent hydrolase
MRIWDMYCHLSGSSGSTPEERVTDLLTYADRMGIERVILYKDASMREYPTPGSLRDHNDHMMELVEGREDRVLGYAYVNPFHREDSLSEIDRCVRDGPLIGIKLFTTMKASNPRVDPIVERAGELNALIFQHSWYKVGGDPPVPGGGNRIRESTPVDVAALAARHPEVPIVCGHAGADWELGIAAVRGHENVYIGMAGYDPTAGMSETAVEELGAERVLYSSDCSGRSFASQLAKVQGAAISDEARRLILGENLRRLLQPILKEKGIAID